MEIPTTSSGGTAADDDDKKIDSVYDRFKAYLEAGGEESKARYAKRQEHERKKAIWGTIADALIVGSQATALSVFKDKPLIAAHKSKTGDTYNKNMEAIEAEYAKEGQRLRDVMLNLEMKRDAEKKGSITHTPQLDAHITTKLGKGWRFAKSDGNKVTAINNNGDRQELFLTQADIDAMYKPKVVAQATQGNTAPLQQTNNSLDVLFNKKK